MLIVVVLWIVGIIIYSQFIHTVLGKVY